MSWLPFWQGTTADTPASENSIDGSTLVDGNREPDESEAYDRLQPGIRRDDPLFLAKVAEFQALLHHPGQTAHNIIKTAGFTTIEQQLLIALPSPRVDSDLYNLQNKNRRRYRFKLLQRGVYQDEPPVIQLALCWFGASFSSLPLDADGNLTAFDDSKFTSSISPDASRADDDGNSLAFLNTYNDEYKHHLAKSIEGWPESRTLATNQADDIDQYLNRFQGPSQRLRLRGGASFTPRTALLQNNVSKSTSSAPPKSKTVRLYGYQGAVNFNVYDSSSFLDAVARLVGPAQTVIFAIYKIAPELAPNGKQFSAEMPKMYLAGRFYAYWDMRKVFCVDGAEKSYAMFVCGLGEGPPHSQWQPFDCDPAYAEAVVYCSRSAESNSNYAALHNGDEAYLRMPLNAEELSPNQYFEWMFVVARILTPGAGCHALNLSEAGILPRCTFGLHREYGDDEPVLFDPKTPGGAGFSPRSWEILVSDAMDAWSNKKAARAEFDVVPTAYDKFRNKCCVNLGLPGVAFETEPIDAAAFLTPAPYDDRFNVRRGASFRKELSDKVHQYLKDALTSEEHDQLDCVNIWANGQFWKRKPITVELGDFGDELKGFNDRWVVYNIHAHMHVIPSAVFIRPIFKTYKAILGDNVSIPFASEGTLQELRSRLTEANISGLNPDTDHFLIHQTADSQNLHPEINPDMTETQRKQANRPSFFISPDTGEGEWDLVRGQIVSPTVWIIHADASSAVVPTMIDPSPWGFCGAYGNMLDAKERYISDLRHDVPQIMATQRIVFGNTDASGDSNGDANGGYEVVEAVEEEEDESELAVVKHTERVLEEVLHHATEIEKEAEKTTLDNAAIPNGDESSMVLLPLTFPADTLTQTEAAVLAKDSSDFPDMYSIPLGIAMSCPYSGCDIMFGSDEADGHCSVGDLISHCEGHFALQGKSESQPEPSKVVTACATCNTVFGAEATDSEKLQHLVDVHNLVYVVQEDERLVEAVEAAEEVVEETAVEAAVEAAPLQEHEPEAMEVDEEEEELDLQSGRASPPNSASKSKPTNKRKRQSTPARQVDSTYRPGGDADDTGDESSGSRSSSMTPAKKPGRAAKKRRMAEKDSIYRPQKGADDTDDDELMSDAVSDDLENPVAKNKKTPSKKRKRNVDPSYHPSTDVDIVIDVVVESVEPDSGDGSSGPKSKKKKTGLEDPSFRPTEPKTQLYVDDQDEELRRSAVPEWEQDPTDPAGKRKRVIREKSTGLGASGAAVDKTAVAKPVKPARVSRAATPARSRAATPARSRAATPAKPKTGKPAKSRSVTFAPPDDLSLSQETPSEGKRRSGRSRQPPQKLGQ